jgi:hypothetical protein
MSATPVYICGAHLNMAVIDFVHAYQTLYAGLVLISVEKPN